jgi:hypothetical protein
VNASVWESFVYLLDRVFGMGLNIYSFVRKILVRNQCQEGGGSRHFGIFGSCSVVSEHSSSPAVQVLVSRPWIFIMCDNLLGPN